MSKLSSIFIDTGAWFAIIDGHDQYHKPAVKWYRHLSEHNAVLTTSNLVGQETAALLSRKLSKEAAIAFLDMIE